MWTLLRVHGLSRALNWICSFFFGLMGSLSIKRHILEPTPKIQLNSSTSEWSTTMYVLFGVKLNQMCFMCFCRKTNKPNNVQNSFPLLFPVCLYSWWASFFVRSTKQNTQTKAIEHTWQILCCICIHKVGDPLRLQVQTLKLCQSVEALPF